MQRNGVQKRFEVEPIRRYTACADVAQEESPFDSGVILPERADDWDRAGFLRRRRRKTTVESISRRRISAPDPMRSELPCPLAAVRRGPAARPPRNMVTEPSSPPTGAEVTESDRLSPVPENRRRWNHPPKTEPPDTTKAADRSAAFVVVLTPDGVTRRRAEPAVRSTPGSSASCAPRRSTRRGGRRSSGRGSSPSRYPPGSDDRR